MNRFAETFSPKVWIRTVLMKGSKGSPCMYRMRSNHRDFLSQEMKVTQVTASVGWIRIGTGAGYRSVSMSGERNKSGDDRKLHGGGRGFRTSRNTPRRCCAHSDSGPVPNSFRAAPSLQLQRRSNSVVVLRKYAHRPIGIWGSSSAASSDAYMVLLERQRPYMSRWIASQISPHEGGAQHEASTSVGGNSLPNC